MQDLGYIYALRADNGVTKVGKSKNPDRRLEDHIANLTCWGLLVEDTWVSEQHERYDLSELFLLAWVFEQRNVQLVGGQEYFRGIDFHKVVRAAEREVERVVNGTRPAGERPSGKPIDQQVREIVAKRLRAENAQSLLVA